MLKKDPTTDILLGSFLKFSRPPNGRVWIDKFEIIEKLVTAAKCY